MVGVGGCNHRAKWVQLEERAVVFVGLHNHIFTLVINHHVGVEILGNASQKGTTAHLGLAKNVGYHARRGGLAVGTGHCNTFLATGKLAQHL